MRCSILPVILFSCLLYHDCPAQQVDTAFTWWNPATSATQAVGGQGWPNELQHTYNRLPARAEKEVNLEVWKLSKQSAGLFLQFKTNASQITIRYGVSGPMAMPHMPATGVSGVDLYGLDTGNHYLWCAGKYAFKDTIEYKFTNLSPTEASAATGITYQLFLPLYNEVKWLEIGVPKGGYFEGLPSITSKPVIVYGTSIVQGACASRPGMAWTNIVSRKLRRPVVNLGFSGTGRLEPAVLNLVNEIEAAAYVLDCLPNLTGGKNAFTQTEIFDRIVNAVKQIRTQHPQTPIILTDHFGYTDAAINPMKKAEYLVINNTNHQAYQRLVKQGMTGVFLLPMEALQQDMDTMVDGIHPTDLGMVRYAAAYQQLIQKILTRHPEK